jgi:GT2 family glycosyltransferase
MARCQIVSYLDDDARADRRLAARMADAFTSPEVAAVTGLVLPAEIQTEAQLFFERHGGMRKGFLPKAFQKTSEHPSLEPQQLGIGANMAFRRRVLEDLNGFDPCLDVGTETRGGGDLDMLYRVLDAGFVIRYEPDALVRHVHRRSSAEVIQQMQGYGVGYSAFLAKRSASAPPDARRIRRRLVRWHIERHLLTPVAALVRGDSFRARTAWAEARGSRLGAAAYRREVARLSREERSGCP